MRRRRHAPSSDRSWLWLERRRWRAWRHQWKRATLPVLFVAVPPAVAGVVLPPGTDRLVLVQTIAWLTFNACLLATAPMLYLRWRITDEWPIAYLTATALAVGLTGLPLAVVDVASNSPLGASSQLAAIFLLGPTFVLTWSAARGIPFPDRHPLTLGVGLGLCGLAAHALRSLTLPDGSLLPSSAWVVFTAVVIGVAAFVVITLPRLRRRLERQQSLPLPIIAVSAVVATLLPPSSLGAGRSATWLVLPLLVLLGALLASTATRLLLDGLLEEAARPQAAPSTLVVPRPRSPRDEELFHELRSTVADISAASDLLLHHAQGLPDDRRHRLERMLDDEMHRLSRLVTGDSEKAGPVSLDEVITPLVLAQTTQGHSVRWQPSGHVVQGRHDDVAEIVHVLLTNARRHGGGVATKVSVTECADAVEISVSDQGPGVDPHLAARLFDRGSCGRDTDGQGLGLYIAHRLATEQGGRLWLARTGDAGAEFVLSLPRRSDTGPTPRGHRDHHT